MRHGCPRVPFAKAPPPEPTVISRDLLIRADTGAPPSIWAPTHYPRIMSRIRPSKPLTGIAILEAGRAARPSSGHALCGDGGGGGS